MDKINWSTAAAIFGIVSAVCGSLVTYATMNLKVFIRGEFSQFEIKMLEKFLTRKDYDRDRSKRTGK